MKTLEKVPLILVKTETIPNEMEPGKFYWSEKYEVANHLCVCGCGMKAPIPICIGEWSITELPNGKFSVTPSLLHLNGCKSHYIITNSIANIV